ncbi:MAG: uridine kinase [Candidatus Eisenbacteria bacterium]|nr:uridine kinase [Candidatus Eisenbacteria bacterium]
MPSNAGPRDGTAPASALPGRRVLLGVAGGSASGKTMVAERIRTELGTQRIAFIKQDSYYRDLRPMRLAERRRQNFDHPDAFDRDLLLEHLRLLLEGAEIRMPVYDFRRHLRLRKTVRVPSCPITILEGILILDDPLLRALMDIKVYIDTDADVRLMRRIRRDVSERGRTLASVLDQYERSVRPMHLQFVAPSKRYADVIIPEGGHNVVGIDLLVTKVRAILAGEREGQA